MVDVLLGLQWGDEGKGKIVDYLASRYAMIARFQGGPNAGHTLYINGEKRVLHTIPSGIFHDGLLNLIGNGVVIDPITLRREIETLELAGVPVLERLKIARKAHLILPTHRLLDAASEAAKGKEKIGSTLRGIGPTYMDKTGRNGLRVGDIELSGFAERYAALREKHLHLLKIYPEVEFDLATEEQRFLEAINFLRGQNLTDGEHLLYEYLKADKSILAEGAQGAMLDIDFGTYPFVTSSNTITAGVCSGLGLAPRYVGQVIGITKAYCTRVGAGPFPTELLDETGDQLRRAGHEFGSTTGRPRRCGWIDLPQLKYSVWLNGVSQLVITKVDVFNDFEQIAACDAYRINGLLTEQMPYDLCHTEIEPQLQHFAGWQHSLAGIHHYEALPASLKSFFHTIEQKLAVPIGIISVGPERDELIVRSEEVLWV